MLPFPIPYKKSRHEEKLVEYFGENGVRCHVKEMGPRCRTYVICFTNRCGSTLLAELISTCKGFNRAGEHMNADGVIGVSKSRGFKTLQQYVAWLQRSKASESGILGLKLNYGQLFFLAATGLIPHAFGEIRFVHVERTDVLAQAVSRVIADETKSWSSLQVSQIDESQVRFNHQKIARVVDGICEANAKFRAFFEVYGIKPIKVTYEDLVQDLQAEGDRVIRELAFANTEGGKVNPGALIHQKQANHLNEIFIRRFRNMYGSLYSELQAMREKNARGGSAAVAEGVGS